MLIEEMVTYLEMTAAEQLRPGRLAPAPVELVKLDQHQAAALLLRRTYALIAAPLNWQSRRTWSDAQWEQLLARPQVHAWIAQVGEKVAGVVELEAQSGGDVEITVFGLIPEFIGRGFWRPPAYRRDEAGLGAGAAGRCPRATRVAAHLVARSSLRQAQL